MPLTRPGASADEVLVIVTGGTIGMAPGPLGLAPQDGRVEAAIERLRPISASVRILRFDPLIDSAHIDPSHWNALIDEVMSWQGAGVVVTHGTDTMAFTGAALAFALAGLDRRVMLCGAMRPLGTDGAAERDLAFALTEARDGPMGTWLAMSSRLLRGHALVKRSSSAEDAFIEIEAGRHELPTPRHRKLRRFARRRLAILTLSPGLPAAALSAALGELDGAVLRVYGQGSAPADEGILAALATAIADGKRIVAVSQCEIGGLAPGSYASGAVLWNTGIEDGGASTPEAALARLWLDLS